MHYNVSSIIILLVLTQINLGYYVFAFDAITVESLLDDHGR